MKALPGEHEEMTKKKGTRWPEEWGKKNKNHLTHSNPQLPTSSYHKGSEEQEDKGTRKPETQDDQGEQEEMNHVVWETSRKEQDNNKKKGTCLTRGNQKKGTMLFGKQA